MGLLDRFKRKKKDKKTDEANVLDMVKEDPVKEEGGSVDKKSEPVKLKEDTKRAHQVLQSYHLSEKSNLLANTGRYVFKVPSSSNKIEVGKAVETVYGVKVVSVNIVNVSGKMRRYGRTRGRTSNWKKAIVTLRAGDKISGLAEGI